MPLRDSLPGDQALERLPAGQGLRQALEVGVADRDVRGVGRRGVQADVDRAGQLAVEQVPLDRPEPGLAAGDVQRRLQAGDLLAHQGDALQVQQAVDLQRLAVELAADALDLPLDVLQRQARLDRVAREDGQALATSRTRAGRPAGPPAQAQVGAHREGVRLVQPVGELRHHRRHELPQGRVDPEVGDVQVVHPQVEPAAVPDADDAGAELDRRAVEVEADLAHGHQSVVVDEPAGDPLHRREGQAARRRRPPARG